MKKILLKYLFVALLLSGCSTIPVKIIPPPLANRLEVLRKSLDNLSIPETTLNESETLAKAYLLAIKTEKDGNRELACNLFGDLASRDGLAIKEAALVHGLFDCDYSISELRRIWKKTLIPSYLKEAYTEQSLKLAVKNNLPLFEAQFSFDLINYRPVQADKVKLIKHAIEIADQLGDGDKSKIYTERLIEISPLYNSKIDDKNIYSIAKDFEANRNFEKARAFYLQIIKGQFCIEEIVKAFNAFRTSFKVERNLKTFLAKTYEMEEFLKKQSETNYSLT